MSDKQFNMLSIAGITLLLWYLFKHRGPDAATVAPTESPALPVSYADPMNNAYAANAGPLGPATPADYSINIANQSAALLNQRYIPLFGFVGMAQGALYG